MRKEKWLLREIDAWQKESLLSGDAAQVLKDRYTPKKNTNLLVILFSIIGTLLIGTGIILIGAKNWYSFPLFLRAGIGFVPLIVSQGLMVFTILKRYNSVAWRESIAILNTAAVFATTAAIGQIFHTPSDDGTFILTCGLLAFPIMCLLNAASPLIVYYWSVLNWLAFNQLANNAVIMLVLIVLGALFVFFNRKHGGAKLQYMLWITVIAGFTAVLFIGSSFDQFGIFMIFCYFVMLLALESVNEEMLFPFKVVGVLGSLTMLSIMAYGVYWIDSFYYENGLMAGVTLSAIMLLIAAVVTVWKFRRDFMKSVFTAAMIVMCIFSGIWTAADIGDTTYYLFLLLFNISLLLLGVGFIVYGTKNASLITTNIGMASVCVWIVLKFLDSELDILWRGIVFLLLGIAFLLVNLQIIRTRKKQKKEAQAE